MDKILLFMKYFLALLLLFNLSSFAQKAKPAEDILNKAYKRAAKEKKNVFVIFHASWCGWCHRMDSAMNAAVCKKFFDNNYVTTHLVIFEAKDKKDLENPGAEDLLKKLHFDKEGIPVWLIFDKDGNLLADSWIRKGEAEKLSIGSNSGCPANAEEVDYFIKVLQKTSTLNPDQLEVIHKRFRENER